MEQATASKKSNKYKWLKFGLLWGALMTLLKGVAEPLYLEEPMGSDTLFHDALFWMSVGLFLGSVMFLITSRRKNLG